MWVLALGEHSVHIAGCDLTAVRHEGQIKENLVFECKKTAEGRVCIHKLQVVWQRCALWLAQLLQIHAGYTSKTSPPKVTV